MARRNSVTVTVAARSVLLAIPINNVSCDLFNLVVSSGQSHHPIAGRGGEHLAPPFTEIHHHTAATTEPLKLWCPGFYAQGVGNEEGIIIGNKHVATVVALVRFQAGRQTKSQDFKAFLRATVVRRIG